MCRSLGRLGRLMDNKNKDSNVEAAPSGGVQQLASDKNLDAIIDTGVTLNEWIANIEFARDDHSTHVFKLMLCLEVALGRVGYGGKEFRAAVEDFSNKIYELSPERNV